VHAHRSPHGYVRWHRRAGGRVAINEGPLACGDLPQYVIDSRGCSIRPLRVSVAERIGFGSRRADSRHTHGARADGDGVPDDAPHLLRVRAGHDRPGPGRGDRGPVCYGPNVTAAATLLASTDVIGVERAADLMGALVKAPVSTGFVLRCLVRLDAALIAAGFEDALKDALRASDVLGTDEAPAPLPPRPPAGRTAGIRTCTRCAPCTPTPAAGRTWSGTARRATAPRQRLPGSGYSTATGGPHA
jgi:hypothetical protein